MLSKMKRFNCPVCKSHLGVFDVSTLFLVDCKEDDCKIKWCYKPNSKLPVAISWPGMKRPKTCNCGSCAK